MLKRSSTIKTEKEKKKEDIVYSEGRTEVQDNLDVV